MPNKNSSSQEDLTTVNIHKCPISQDALTTGNANEFILVKSITGQDRSTYYFIRNSKQNQFFGLDTCPVTRAKGEYKALYLKDLSAELKKNVIGLTDNTEFNPFFAKEELQSHIKTGSFTFKTVATNPATTLEEFKNLLASYPLQKHATIDPANNESLLHYFSKKHKKEFVLALITAGVSINNTTLHDAAAAGLTQVAKNLIEISNRYSPIINAKNNLDMSPLHYAMQNGHTETAQALIELGANKEAKDNYGLTPLHYAMQNGHTKTSLALINLGADINAKANNGWTPLHVAAHGGHSETVLALITEGADINAKANNGWTPFGIAKYSSKYKIALILILAKTKAFFSKKFVPIIIYISLVASLLLAAHLSPPLMLLLSGPVMGYLNCLNNLFFIVLVFDDYTNYSPRRYFFSDYLTHDELFFAFFVTGVPLFIAAFFSPSLEILLSGPMLLCSLPVIQVATLSLISIPFIIALLNYFDRMDPEQGERNVSESGRTTALGPNQLVVNAATPANTSKIRAAGAAEDLRSGIKVTR